MDKLDRLHQAPMFSGCDRKALGRLAASIDTVEVPEGTTLFRQDAFQHEAFVIESGTAEVAIDGEIVAEIPEGEMIGEIGLLTRSAATATVTAKTPMSLLVIPHQHFAQILEDTPGLGTAIARELAQRLQALDERLH